MPFNQRFRSTSASARPALPLNPLPPRLLDWPAHAQTTRTDPLLLERRLGRSLSIAVRQRQSASELSLVACPPRACCRNGGRAEGRLRPFPRQVGHLRADGVRRVRAAASHALATAVKAYTRTALLRARLALPTCLPRRYAVGLFESS
eukprot:6179244-Pleurochrysis_carterae.AAC.1